MPVTKTVALQLKAVRTTASVSVAVWRSQSTSVAVQPHGEMDRASSDQRSYRYPPHSSSAVHRSTAAQPPRSEALQAGEMPHLFPSILVGTAMARSAPLHANADEAD